MSWVGLVGCFLVVKMKAKPDVAGEIGLEAAAAAAQAAATM